MPYPIAGAMAFSHISAVNRPGARLAIWGYGREGRATDAFLGKLGVSLPPTIVLDQADPALGHDRPILTGDEGREAIADGAFDLIVKSPGISLYRLEVARARAAGTIFSSGTNLWFERYRGARTLVVTGTKGKSTTASLIHHMLDGSGDRVELAGNVGRALLTIEPASDLTVLELSSYQLADLAFAPTAVLVTNLSPEHQDWHQGTERYYADKLRVLALEPRPLAILNADCPELMERAPERFLPFQSPGQWYADDQGLTVRGEPVALDAFPLPGRHNRINLAAALAAIEAMGFDWRACLTTLSTFRALPHRLEQVGERGGLLFINDSISTTPVATLAALDAFPRSPITLIAGGFERGQDFSSLLEALAERSSIRLIGLPDNGHRMVAEAAIKAPELAAIVAENLNEAVEWARRDTPAGGIVLLSPAAPSFGHFKSFEERGDLFRKLIEGDQPPA